MTLPEEFGQLLKLEKLYLNDNLLTELPYNLTLLKNSLKILVVAGNRLEYPPMDVKGKQAERQREREQETKRERER